MNWKILFAGLSFIAFCIGLNGCKKELSCENCLGTNQFPVSIAGNDTIITLPKDSVLLNGSASYDPDGTIVNFEWTKISGPAALTNVSGSKNQVNGLAPGIYIFELMVTDNGGLSSKDSIMITVLPGVFVNHPPVANAGLDQSIILPVNSIILNGSASTDPDNNISGYSWTKLSGPTAYGFIPSLDVQVQLNNLVAGEYRFELKVTDVMGLYSRDTMKLNVSSSTVQLPCSGNSRPQIPVQMIPFGTLSQLRDEMVVTSAGNKILFAGGYSNFQPSSRVDIFNIATNSWSTAELSIPRFYFGHAVLGNSIFFAGGQTASGTIEITKRIDIYNASNNSWSIDSLKYPSMLMSGGAAENKVVFAGGMGPMGNGAPIAEQNWVEIFDVATQVWTNSSMPSRTNMESLEIATTVVGNKIYFAGGAGDWFAWDFGGIYTPNVDIYNATTGSWAASELLSTMRGDMASIAVGNKIFWAGGRTEMFGNTYLPTDLVEIRDVTTSISTFSCLFQPNLNFTAVQKNSKIIFFTKGLTQGNWLVPGTVTNKIDIYDYVTNTWSVGLLPFDIYNASIISVYNIIYVAGGYVNGVLSNQVYKLEF
jgi:hypothetical protein